MKGKVHLKNMTIIQKKKGSHTRDYDQTVDEFRPSYMRDWWNPDKFFITVEKCLPQRKCR